MSELIKECDKLMEFIGNLEFDKALPLMQDGLWIIADKYNTTGGDVFKEYMNWKNKQNII